MAELILLGEQMAIEEAKELNIVNRVVPAEHFEATVRDWAQQLAAKSPLMMKLGKRALLETQDQPLMQALSQLSHYLTLAQCSEDIKEGVAAFVAGTPSGKARKRTRKAVSRRCGGRYCFLLRILDSTNGEVE